jgi:hypothetical protein
MILIRSVREAFTGHKHYKPRKRFIAVRYRTVHFLLSFICCMYSMLVILPKLNWKGYEGGPSPCIMYM